MAKFLHKGELLLICLVKHLLMIEKPIPFIFGSKRWVMVRCTIEGCVHALYKILMDSAKIFWAPYNFISLIRIILSSSFVDSRKVLHKCTQSSSQWQQLQRLHLCCGMHYIVNKILQRNICFSSKDLLQIYAIELFRHRRAQLFQSFVTMQ